MLVTANQQQLQAVLQEHNQQQHFRTLPLTSSPIYPLSFTSTQPSSNCSVEATPLASPLLNSSIYRTSSSPSTGSPSLDVEYFIDLVHDCPSIWNIRSGDYKDNLKRKNSWESIESLLGGTFTMDFLKNQWKNLRDSFRRCLNRQKPSGSDGTAKACKFYKNLEFLRETVQSNKVTDSNFDFCIAQSTRTQAHAPSTTLQSVTKPTVNKRL